MKRRGPVVLIGPPLSWQPWIEADVALIRDWLQDKYGLTGVVYHPSTGEMPFYQWTATGLR